MVKAIIFDYWGTLFSYGPNKENPFSVFAKAIKVDDVERVIRTFEVYFMTQQFDDPKIPLKKVLEDLSVKYDSSLVERLVLLINDMSFSVPFPETFDVLSDLRKKGFGLAMISNMMPQNFAILNNQYNLSKIFDVITASCDVHIIKPDHKIFEITLERLGLRKSEVIMVGDSLRSDVLGAENFGIKAVLVDRMGIYPDYPDRVTSLFGIFDYIS